MIEDLPEELFQGLGSISSPHRGVDAMILQHRSKLFHGIPIQAARLQHRLGRKHTDHWDTSKAPRATRTAGGITGSSSLRGQVIRVDVQE